MPDPADVPRPWCALYPPGVPPEASVPDRAVTWVLDRAARDHPTRAGLVAGRRSWSWSEVRDLVDRAAALLADTGVGAGDRVAVVAGVTPAATIAMFAAWRLGAVAVPLDPRWSDAVLGDRLAVVSPAAVVAEVGALDAVDAARPRLVACRAVLVTDHHRWGTGRDRLVGATGWLIGARRPHRDDDVGSFDALLDSGPALVRQAPVGPTTPAVVVWTAGTTSSPRPVVQTHGNLLAAAVQVREWVVDVRDGREVALIGIPPWRGGGLGAALLPAVHAAASVVLVPDPVASAVAAAVTRHRATVVTGSPGLFDGLAARAGRVDLSTLGIALSVGAPLRAATVRRFEDALPAARLRQAYGQTECTGIALAAPLYGEVDRGPIGLPVTGTVAVVGRLGDMTTLAAPGEVGELLVAGPQVSPGTWRGPDEPPASTGPWLATGDAATVAEDGVFTLLGRVGELVHRQGQLVVPSLVERALRRHPRIASAVVLGGRGADGTEELVAVVVPAGRRRVTTRRVLDHLAPLVAPPSMPTRVVVLPELPRTPTGAADRRRLRARLELERPDHDGPTGGTPPGAAPAGDARVAVPDRTARPPGAGPDAGPGAGPGAGHDAATTTAREG